MKVRPSSAPVIGQAFGLTEANWTIGPQNPLRQFARKWAYRAKCLEICH